MSTNEKIKKWVQKAFQGEKGYELIVQKNGEWRYYSENYSAKLNSFTIVFEEDGIFRFLYEWDSKETVEQKQLLVVIKEQKKMMIGIGENVLVFGFPDLKCGIGKIMVLYEGEGVGTIAVASAELSELSIVNYLQSNEHDILQDTIKEVVRWARANQSMEGGKNSAEYNKQANDGSIRE